MTTEALIKKTVRLLKTLPEDKVQEMADYIQIKKEELELQAGIEALVESGDSFKFLHDEEDIYSLSDLKEKF